MAFGVPAMRRGIARGAVALALGLSGCAGQGGDAAKIGGLLFQSFTGGAMITREQASDIPYASIGIQLGSSSQGLAVLGKTLGDERYWYSGNRILFVTRGGRIVQTVGLPYDLKHVSVRGPSGGWVAPGTAAQFTMLFDFDDLQAFNVVANCTDADKGAETIVILGSKIQTQHHIESCKVEQLDWSFDNDFWIDPKSGYVWQSEQDIHPRSSVLSVMVFRPEGGTPQAASP